MDCNKVLEFPDSYKTNGSRLDCLFFITGYLYLKNETVILNYDIAVFANL